MNGLYGKGWPERNVFGVWGDPGQERGVDGVLWCSEYSNQCYIYRRRLGEWMGKFELVWPAASEEAIKLLRVEKDRTRARVFDRGAEGVTGREVRSEDRDKIRAARRLLCFLGLSEH